MNMDHLQSGGVAAWRRFLSLRGAGVHQPEQRVGGAIGLLAGHENARANASKFATAPLTRSRGGECGSMLARRRSRSGRRFVHHDCAKEMKNCWSAANVPGWAVMVALPRVPR